MYSNPGAHGNVVPPARPLLIRVSKGGGPWQGGRKSAIVLTWGQLPVDDGQENWCQDV